MILFPGQGRLDGAFCDYTEEDKMNFLNEVHHQGVRNIEMESLCFAAMCHHAGVKCKSFSKIYYGNLPFLTFFKI